MMTFSWDPDGRIIVLPDSPHVGEWETLARAHSDASKPLVDTIGDDLLWMAQSLNNIEGMLIYADQDPTVGTWEWTRGGGWRHHPYRQPRPWKVHQSRFRQRSRR